MSNQKTEEREFPHNCPECGYGTKRARDLERHRCKKAKELKCNLCSFVAATSFNLTRHKTTVHISIPKTTLVNKCDVCAFVATDSSDLLEHKKVHDETVELNNCTHYNSETRLWCTWKVDQLCIL